MQTERRKREVKTLHQQNAELRIILRGLLELVLAIQENNPAMFLPALNYNQRVLAAKDVLGDSPRMCPECGGSGYDHNPLNDPGPCNRCSGLGEINGTTKAVLFAQDQALELLRRVDHTLTAHGQLHASTPLHDAIQLFLPE